jgi:hypothetical protein
MVVPHYICGDVLINSRPGVNRRGRIAIPDLPQPADVALWVHYLLTYKVVQLGQVDCILREPPFVV